jgi:phosphonate transport system substrate-binding protein
MMKVGARMSLAEPWLEGELSSLGLPRLKALFGHVAREKKLSRALLPVFFGKADACLVTRHDYDLMCELNPQIQRTLKPLAVSRVLVPSVTCLRRGYNSAHRTDIIDALGKLHEEPKGQQILSLFGVDRLVPFEEHFLDTAMKLVGYDRVAGTDGGTP